MNSTSAIHECTLDVLRQFRDLPILWDKRSVDYNNKTKRNASYEVLLSKYREMYPQAKRADLKKFLNTLMTTFWNDFTSVQKLGNAFLPTCWYYNEMLFLVDFNVKDDAQSRYYGAVNAEEIEKAPQRVEEDLNLNYSSTPINHMSDHTYAYVKKDRVTYQNYRDQYAFYQSNKKRQPQIIQVNSDLNNNQANRQKTDDYGEDDDFLKITKGWAVELRSMDPLQQIYAKKAINDILFEGQMGTLTRESVEINAWNQPNMAGRPTVEEFASMSAEDFICIPKEEE